MAPESAVALVQKFTGGDYADDAEASGILEALDRVLAWPSGYVSGLIFWPKSRNPAVAEVVDLALAYRFLAW
ncbi:e9imm peptide [Streptomyces sp. CBMA152]|uniref:e9imm peptide n=1 Tax=Streptomyces sp. CBMA152 TaxID=1896312 RepID=UPI001660F4B2|nr:e9imm peptide [Streptomyces sp. CBMA152]MBD0746674.1 e9imm peptide [Streptomyces sp. CBMA152]